MSASDSNDVSGDTPYERLKNLMTRLRNECPWDNKQSFETISPYTIEEAYEVDDAIQRKDMGELKEELGDLLFQVVFHSKLAEEEGAFTLDDVTNNLVEKMVRRHNARQKQGLIGPAPNQSGIKWTRRWPK